MNDKKNSSENVPEHFSKKCKTTSKENRQQYLIFERLQHLNINLQEYIKLIK